MKKIYALLIITFFFSVFTVKSQSDIYIGAGGTVLNTWVTSQNNFGYPDMDYSTTMGGAGNINFGYDFNKHIGLKLEIGYAKLGQNSKDKIDSNSYTRKVKLYYLQIPVLFKYKTGGEVARFYLLVGPQFGLLLNAKQEFLKNSDPDDRIVHNLQNIPHIISEETITDRYNSLDISARLDAGFDFTVVKNLVLNTGLSFNYGFLDINKTDWQIKDSSGNYKASNNIYVGLNLGLVYVFDLGKK
jgi:outer membrane protein W